MMILLLMLFGCFQFRVDSYSLNRRMNSPSVIFRMQPSKLPRGARSPARVAAATSASAQSAMSAPAQIAVSSGSFSSSGSSNEQTGGGGNFALSIENRTTECLDFSFVLDAVKQQTVTIRGAQRYADRVATDAASAAAMYAQVEQIGHRLGMIPLRSAVNIWPVLDGIKSNSAPPERDELAYFANEIEQILELQGFLSDNIEDFDLLLDYVEAMELPHELVSVFKDSFDEDLNLNAEKYPDIKRIRKAIASLREKIVQTMKSLLQMQDMKEKIADQCVPPSAPHCCAAVFQLLLLLH